MFSDRIKNIQKETELNRYTEILTELTGPNGIQKRVKKAQKLTKDLGSKEADSSDPAGLCKYCACGCRCPSPGNGNEDVHDGHNEMLHDDAALCPGDRGGSDPGVSNRYHQTIQNGITILSIQFIERRQ